MYLRILRDIKKYFKNLLNNGESRAEKKVEGSS